MNEQKQKKNINPKANAAAGKTNSFPFAIDIETCAFVIRRYDIKSFVPCDMKKHGVNFLDDEFLCPPCCGGEFPAYDMLLFRELMKHIEGKRGKHAVDDYIKGVQGKVATWCTKIAPVDKECRASKWNAGRREGISRGVRRIGVKVLQWALEVPKASYYTQYPGVENITILNLDDFREGAETIQGVKAGGGHCTPWVLHDFMIATLNNFCAFLKTCAGQFLPCAKTVGSIIRDVETFQGAFASTRIELRRALEIRDGIMEKLKVLSDELFEYECSTPQEHPRKKGKVNYPQDEAAIELLKEFERRRAMPKYEKFSDKDILFEMWLHGKNCKYKFRMMQRDKKVPLSESEKNALEKRDDDKERNSSDVKKALEVWGVYANSFKNRTRRKW